MHLSLLNNVQPSSESNIHNLASALRLGTGMLGA